MSARHANSFRTALAASHCSILYPHWQQSCCLFVTPTPQPLQGWVSEPLRSLTRWNTKVRKTAFTTEPRWTQGQPFACVVSLRHIACISISAVAHLFNRWAPRPGGGVPRGPHYGRLGPQGLGLREAAEARPHNRGSRLDVHIELFVYVGESRRTCSCQFLSPWGPLWGPI